MRESQELEVQWHVWRRFSAEANAGTSASNFAPAQLLFLLDTIENLADLDNRLDPRVYAEMAKWLQKYADDERAYYGEFELRIFEVVAICSDAIEDAWVTRYLEFLAATPGHTNAKSGRIALVLRGVQATAPWTLTDWLTNAKSESARVRLASLMSDDITGTSPNRASEEGLVVGHRRAELFLHVMQLLCPDVFWDDGGGFWCPRLYSSIEGALSDYPWFEQANIDNLVQSRLVSGAEAQDLARFAEAARSELEAGEGFENGAITLRRALEGTIEPDGLLQTLLNLRSMIINLRRSSQP